MRLLAERCYENSDRPATRGRVFNIQRFSLHDGPGIRTVVFMQGCMMQCAWCANPEGIDREAFNPLNGQSTWVSVEDVWTTVIADEMYYRTSGGGVTISGGEMILQSGFVRALLIACRNEGIHTAVETAGFGSVSALAEACEFADLILYDLKIADEEKHLIYTGVSNKPVLKNLAFLLEGNTPVRIRIPVIPEVNDTPAQARKMMALIHKMTQGSACFAGIDLLPYHPFGEGKYKTLGLPYRYHQMHSPLKKANTGALENAAKEYNLPVNILAHCIG